jgi:hypothetical protein
VAIVCCNGEPGMIDGAASGVTKRRHIFSVDVAPRKRSCTFFYRIYPKENNIIRKTDEIPRNLRLIHAMV